MFDTIERTENDARIQYFDFLQMQGYINMAIRKKDAVKNGDKSFSKLFDIIEEIARSRNGLKGREIAERNGLPVSTAFRMLKFLVENGYLRSSASTYTLGLGIARLGNIAAAQNPLLKVSRPLLAELSAKTMETVHLAELKDHQILYVDKVEGVRSVRMGSLIGNYSPLFCTGIGKAILAFLDSDTLDEQLQMIEWKQYTDTTLQSAPALLSEIRKRGYAIDNCEHEIGVYCLAAPILDYTGHAVAGISISGSELYLRNRTEELAALVKDAALRISKEYHG